MGDRLKTGRHWEAQAEQYLRAHGLRVLRRGYRCRLGELDLVCVDGSTLVIVEVRARAGNAAVQALESIGWRKRRRIIQATRHLLMRNPQWSDLPCRFDAFTIDGIDTDAPQVQWVKNAFDAG